MYFIVLGLRKQRARVCTPQRSDFKGTTVNAPVGLKLLLTDHENLDVNPGAQTRGEGGVNADGVVSCCIPSNYVPKPLKNAPLV